MATKVTLVYSLRNSFVQRDIDLLEQLGYRVETIVSPPDKNPLKFIFNRLREFLLSLIYLPQSKALVVWFSDYHSFVPLLIAKLLGLKSLLILGGYDVVSDTENRYGLFYHSGIRRMMAKQNFKWARKLWAVDESLLIGCKTAAVQNSIRSGLNSFAPDQLKKATTVPTAYDSSFWSRKNHKKDTQSILTVGLFSDKRVAIRKGIPLFLELASQCPDFRFTVVGEQNASLSSNFSFPPNVTIYPKLSPQELQRQFGTHQFYFQGSRVEGLPNVLCEAMLCECIPIGRAVFGIPKAIGETGFLFTSLTDFTPLIKFLHSVKIQNGIAARKRMISKFSIAKRAAAFERFLQTSDKNTHA
jgi:hypothetical protein